MSNLFGGSQLEYFRSSLDERSQASVASAIQKITEVKKRGGKVMVVTGSGPNIHEGVTTLIAELIRVGIVDAVSTSSAVISHEMAGSLDRVFRVDAAALGMDMEKMPRGDVFEFTCLTKAEIEKLKQEMHWVKDLFAGTLRKLREEKGLSQKQLGEKVFVTRSAVARWENASRLPDAVMIVRLADCLGVDVNSLFQLAAQSEESPNVIMVDDSKVILSDALSVLGEAMPDANITGFIWPLEAVEYAKKNPVALAMLDIELGTESGLDLCNTLLEINPSTNIIFLTAYADYSLDAWKTKASGFLLKPLTIENVKEQLKKLRYPFSIGADDK